MSNCLRPLSVVIICLLFILGKILVFVRKKQVKVDVFSVERVKKTIQTTHCVTMLLKKVGLTFNLLTKTHFLARLYAIRIL